MIDIDIRITIPVIEGLDVDISELEKAGVEAARQHMRQRGGRRGQNLVGMPQAAAKGVEKELGREVGLKHHDVTL